MDLITINIKDKVLEHARAFVENIVETKKQKHFSYECSLAASNTIIDALSEYYYERGLDMGYSAISHELLKLAFLLIEENEYKAPIPFVKPARLRIKNVYRYVATLIRSYEENLTVSNYTTFQDGDPT